MSSRGFKEHAHQPVAAVVFYSISQELREANELLRLKIAKLEQLLTLKDTRLQRLMQELEYMRRAKGDPSDADFSRSPLRGS